MWFIRKEQYSGLKDLACLGCLLHPALNCMKSEQNLQYIPPHCSFQIYLRFLEYQMENSNECKKNFVAVYDGSNAIEDLKVIYFIIYSMLPLTVKWKPLDLMYFLLHNGVYLSFPCHTCPF